ncbi:pilin [Candidatus Wolfebacteria bacterium]|nr:pilin [Candidatus Wolfebacteria bacterium]
MRTMRKVTEKILQLTVLGFGAMPLVVSAETLESLIRTKLLILVNPIILVVSGLALVFFFWGIAKLILSAGDEKGREEGKKVMLWGIIALFVLFSVWGIVQLLQRSLFDGVLPPPAPFSSDS